MKKWFPVFLALFALQAYAEDPVQLRTLSCSGKRTLASHDEAIAKLSGLVHKYADGSLRLVFYEGEIEIGDDFTTGKGKDVETVEYHPSETGPYKDHVRFPLQFAQGESVSLLFPSEFKAHGELTVYLRFSEVLGGAYGDLALSCR